MTVIAEFDVALREAEATEPDQIRFCGELFDIAADVGAMPLMRFAHAVTDTSVPETQALGAAYRLLRECLAVKDWDRFERLATEKRAEYDDLMPVARRVYAHVTARPTKRPSGSSDGPQPTTENSKHGSSSLATVPASADWERPESRPDLVVPMVSVDALAGI